MTSANLTRSETAERSAAIKLQSIRVELDLTNAIDPTALGFSTLTTLEFDSLTESTWLDFIGRDVRSVVVNGIERDIEWDGARIRLTGLTPANTVTIHAEGAYSRSGEGMHRFVDPVDGATYLYTQYEPADSRRVMACFEQPDMKAATSFVVQAPCAWQVLSNQSVISQADDGPNQRVEFAPTLPVSSYITAVAAGPYHRVESSWKREDVEIPLAVLCRASLSQYLDAQEIFEITQQGLDFYHDHFGFPYPWGKYDQIFVPEYNLGAMENPGLVTFTESYVFRGAATQSQREARANTILHEMAHMWFGDLVTMKWWDDLWLKESFADYMGSHVCVAATRFTSEWVSFANSRKAWAYTQDQLPTTHPIVADIPDLEAAKLNFDGITYAKGAAVLKQLVAYVGEDAFFEGARRYFAAHAWANTTLNDLLVELEAACGRSLTDWAQAWLQTTGMSTLTPERDATGIWINQDSPRMHTLKVGCYSLDASENLRLVEKIEVTIERERTHIQAPDSDLILLNDEDLTYAKVRLDARSLAAVASSLSTLPDELARGIIWSALWNGVRDGVVSVSDYLDIIAKHAPAETNGGIVSVVLAHGLYAVENFLPNTKREQARSRWLSMVKAGCQSCAGDSLAWARAFAAAATYCSEENEAIQALLNGTQEIAGVELDTDLRWRFVVALATTGHLTEAEISAERGADNTAAGRENELLALSSRPTVDARLSAWDSIWNDESLSNELLSATIQGFTGGGRRDLVQQTDAEYFERIGEAWRTRSIEMARRIVRDAFPMSDSPERARAWLESNPQAPNAMRRLIIEQTDNLARNLRVRAANS